MNISELYRKPHTNMLALGDQLFARLRPRTLRTRRQFAEAEIILPDGPFAGQRFNCDRQPLTGLALDAMEDPYWSQFVGLGPRQASKTLTFFIVPILYHLFEVGEDVILAAPTQEINATKWDKVLRPIIEASRYRDLLPKTGASSSEGSSNLRKIRFGNGAWLFFKSAGGGKGRSKGLEGDSARVIVVTEVEGFKAGTKSGRAQAKNDPDPLGKLRKSTAAYSRHARPLIYLECTTTTKSGITWSLYERGSGSRLAVCCPHCRRYVTCEREHLVGWQDAADMLAAKAQTRLACPDCGAQWTETDRVLANARPLLLHRGQTVNGGGQIAGPVPRTDVLGFRWTMVNNMFTTMGDAGKEEWLAPQSEDPEDAEMQLLQYTWARPFERVEDDLTVIDYRQIMARVDKTLPRGHVPDGATCLTLGVDVGKYLLRWIVLGWRPLGDPHAVDYGVVEVQSRTMDEKAAIIMALRQLRDEILPRGWLGADGTPAYVKQGLVDAGYLPEAVYAFVDETPGGGQFQLFASQGFSSTKKNMEKYIRRTGRGTHDTLGVGQEYQAVTRTDGTGLVLQINVDHWKGFVHARFQTPPGYPGAATLFAPDPSDPNCHMTLAKHLVAEKKVEEFIAGRGQVTRWVALSRNNHYFDAYVYACVAAHALGVRLGAAPVMEGDKAKAAPAAEPAAPIEREGRGRDGNPLTGYRGKW